MRRTVGRLGFAIGVSLPSVVAVVLLAWFMWPVPAGSLRGTGCQSLTVTDRNGRELREVLSSRSGVAHWVALEEIEPQVRAAVLAAEDRRFFRHPGIDPLALARAAVSNVRARRVVSGASTITQQLVRSLYPGARRSAAVKLAEALVALRIERHWSKVGILEAYLNRVPFGNRTFGIEAAARLYLGRSCHELSLAQSCFLVAIPRAPTYYDPYRHFDRARGRQRWILGRMRRYGLITDIERETALAESIVLIPPGQRFRAPHFTDMVLARAGDMGDTSRVRTSLDLDLQRTCEGLLRRQLGLLARNHATNGAVVVLDRVSGDVLAMVGSRDYFDPDAGQVNACLSPRQTGSAVKPFAYAAAFEDGMTAATVLPDVPYCFAEGTGDYRPVNYDRGYHGPVTARRAFGCSYNIPAVRVAERIGPDRLLAVLEQVGITSLDWPAEHYGLALVLGVGDVRLLELVNAYRVLANAGVWSPVRLGPSAAQPDERVEVFSPQVCRLVTDILCDNDARAPAFGEHSCLDLPFPCAVKTGTSKDYRDNWTIGYTSEYVVGVWVGNFDGTPMHRVSGVTGAGPLFRDVMLGLHDESPAPLAEPAGMVRCRVCPKSGKLVGPYCPNGIEELFVAGTEPSDSCDVHQVFRFDRFTGEPVAGPFDSSRVVERVLEVYPPAYWSWMEQNGIPLPPVMTEEESASHRPLVLFPDDGDVFKVDPDVARAAQSLYMQAAVPAGAAEVVWVMDGQELARVKRPYSLFWDIEPGEHRVRVRAGRDRSEEVRFLVLP